MEKERFAYLFQQYVDKNCSSEELTELMTMLRNAGDQDTLESVLDNFWDRSPEIELDKLRSEEILDAIIAQNPANNPRLSGSRSFRIGLGWAAALIMVSIAGFLLLKQPQKPVQIAAKAQHKSELPVNHDESVVSKTLDEHQKITLPDGSTVILNNNSSLTYPKVFQADKREVVLTGEGYFDIKHDDKKSFTVYTGKIKTTVLGTAFNIRAYENDKNITVTVTRGKVSVVDDHATLGILTPNQQIVFNKNYQKSNLSKVLASTTIEWQQGDLFFDDISMEEAAQILSSRFNTPISFSNAEAKRCRFTATFLKGESLDEILKIICSYNNAQYQTLAGRITIKGKGCEQ